MRKLWQTLRSSFILLPVLLILVLVAVGLTYLAGQVAIQPSAPATLPAPLNLTVDALLPGTPVAPYPRLDPAIVALLNQDASIYGETRLSLSTSGIQPPGAYLPRTGNTLFELIPPTPLPTPLPYPTSPPLPLPPLPELPEDSVLNPDGTPRTLPYGGDACAPAGNPVEGILTQRFHLYHAGIDLAVPLGTPVLATHSGTVIYADWSAVGYGYLVIVQNDIFITYYAHNMSFNVSVDDQVGKGSIIAWSGSTGNSTGPHVHYEVRINDVPIDPMTFESRGYASC